jgi:hypothetical protein
VSFAAPTPPLPYSEFGMEMTGSASSQSLHQQFCHSKAIALCWGSDFFFHCWLEKSTPQFPGVGKSHRFTTTESISWHYRCLTLRRPQLLPAPIKSLERMREKLAE